MRVRLVSLPDGIELYRRETNYFGETHPYPEWAARGAALVRTEIARCIDAATEKTTPGLVHHRPPASTHGQFAVVTR